MARREAERERTNQTSQLSNDSLGEERRERELE